MTEMVIGAVATTIVVAPVGPKIVKNGDEREELGRAELCGRGLTVTSVAALGA